MKTKKKRVLAVFLSLVMALSIVGALPASAAVPVENITLHWWAGNTWGDFSTPSATNIFAQRIFIGGYVYYEGVATSRALGTHPDDSMVIFPGGVSDDRVYVWNDDPGAPFGRIDLCQHSGNRSVTIRVTASSHSEDFIINFTPGPGIPERISSIMWASMEPGRDWHWENIQPTTPLIEIDLNYDYGNTLMITPDMYYDNGFSRRIGSAPGDNISFISGDVPWDSIGFYADYGYGWWLHLCPMSPSRTVVLEVSSAGVTPVRIEINYTTPPPASNYLGGWDLENRVVPQGYEAHFGGMLRNPNFPYILFRDVHLGVGNPVITATDSAGSPLAVTWYFTDGWFGHWGVQWVFHAYVHIADNTPTGVATVNVSWEGATHTFELTVSDEPSILYPHIRFHPLPGPTDWDWVGNLALSTANANPGERLLVNMGVSDQFGRWWGDGMIVTMSGGIAGDMLIDTPPGGGITDIASWAFPQTLVLSPTDTARTITIRVSHLDAPGVYAVGTVNVSGQQPATGNGGETGDTTPATTPRPIPTPTPIPTDVSIGDIEIAIEVEDEQVTLELTEENISDIVSEALEDGGDTVVIDLSDLPDDVISAVLPGEAWTAFGEAGLGLDIEMPAGTLSFDMETLLAVGEFADGAEVVSTIYAVETAGLTAAQQNVVRTDDIVLRITLSAGGENITNLGGQLAVTVDYDGPLPVNVWRVTDDGTLELLNSWYNEEDGTVTFVTSRLSVFMLGQPMQIMRFAVGNAFYIYRGALIQIEAAPFIDTAHNRTMVPIRAIAEGLGAEVDWVYDTRTVFITRGTDTISLTIGEPLPYGMGVAVIINSRTMVPIRYIAEVLGATVYWDYVNNAVYIYG